MSATNAFETDILEWAFNAAADPLSGVTDFWISLHTANPGETGSQNTSEAAYTGYARLEVARDNTGFTVSGNTATNAAQLTFGKCTASPGSDITYVGLGLSESGAGTLIDYVALDNPIVMATGATPIFEAGALDFTAD
jgi:hypothetical protein